MVSFLLALILALPVRAASPAVFDDTNERLQSLISFSPQELSVSGRDVLVAVIDSGVSFKVPALRTNLVPGWNFVSGDEQMIDYDGHGTAVAGIVLELAPQASLLPLVVARNGGASVEALVGAIVYAINHEAAVINLSIGVTEEILEDVLRAVGPEALQKSLLVISAGNDSRKLPPFSAKWKNVITVAAMSLDLPLALAHYSAYGNGVDIAVPSGVAGDGIATWTPQNTRRLFNGTSGAAPVVAGAAALLKEKYPNADGASLKQKLLNYSCRSHNIKVKNGRVLNIESLLKENAHCMYEALPQGPLDPLSEDFKSRP